MGPLIEGALEGQDTGVLGIGLLMREYGRALEINPDDPSENPLDCPPHLLTSQRGGPELDKIHQLLENSLKNHPAVKGTNASKHRADEEPESGPRCVCKVPHYLFLIAIDLQ